MSVETTVLAIPNISEGRDRGLVERIAGDTAVLDIHTDVDHHRSVITYGGTPDVIRDVTTAMVDRAAASLDISAHEGVHPRFGVVDVLPFVLYDGSLDIDAYLAEVVWQIGLGPGIPTFRYGIGTDTTLPELRKGFRGTSFDAHPTAGVLCIGFREPLIAFNVFLDEPLQTAKDIATLVRTMPGVRALAFAIGSREITQVSMNLTALERTGPRAAYTLVSRYTRRIVEAEVVGLVPEHTLEQFDGMPMAKAPRTVEAASGRG